MPVFCKQASVHHMSSTPTVQNYFAAATIQDHTCGKKKQTWSCYNHPYCSIRRILFLMLHGIWHFWGSIHFFPLSTVFTLCMLYLLG